MDVRGVSRRTLRYLAAACRRGLRMLGAALRRVGLGGRRATVALGAGGAAIALILALALAFRAHAPVRRSPAPRRPQVLGYFENGWSQIFRDSFPTVRAHQTVIDTVLAFWYSLDGQGRLREPSGPPRADVIRYVRSHHMRMGVLINNLGANMLWTAAVRSRSISAIAATVRANGYQAVEIDFELLPSDARNDFTSFVAGLRQALPKAVGLSVAVFPHVGVTSDVNGVYDYQALARYVDYEVIMLYDKHSPGGPSGPISPWPWVQQNVNYFRHILPGSKIVVAAGVYGYDWPVGSTQAAEWPLTHILEIQAEHHATAHVDAASRNPYFKYTDSNGNAHVVWYQDSATVRRRIDLVTHLGLRGIAIWRLGEGDAKVWQVLEEASK